MKDLSKWGNRDWQGELNREPNFLKRKIIIFEALDNIETDTSNWKERLETEKELENELPTNKT